MISHYGFTSTSSEQLFFFMLNAEGNFSVSVMCKRNPLSHVNQWKKTTTQKKTKQDRSPSQMSLT